MLPSEELTVGTPAEPGLRRVRLGDADVLLARLESDEVVAFGASCPHQGTPLDDATLWDGNLRCRRHLYLYDPRTGRNVLPTTGARPGTLWKLRPGYLPVHRVEERDGWIWVSEAPEPPPPGYDPSQEGPPPSSPLHEPAPSAASGSGPVEHGVRSVRVVAGEEFNLVLRAAPRPGHLWRAEVDGDLLRHLGERFDPAEGSYRIRLAARGEGEATVRCSYLTPWEAVAKEVQSFVVTVEPRPDPGPAPP